MAAKPSSQAPPADVAALVPAGSHAGSPPLLLERSIVVVGTDKRCHLHLLSSSISRHHAVIVSGKDGVYIRDLASRTKVLVNDRQVHEAFLKDRDTVQIGRFIFKFKTPQPAQPKSAAKAALTVNDEESLPVENRVLLIGRHEAADVRILDDSVSMRHAIIFEAAGRRYIRDFYSRTGTFLNGKKIHQEEIKFGDEVRIGPAKLSLSASASNAAVANAPAKLVFEREAAQTDESAELDIGSEIEAALDLPSSPAPQAAKVKPPAAPIARPVVAPQPEPLELPLEDVPLEEIPADEIPALAAPIEAASPDATSAKIELDPLAELEPLTELEPLEDLQPVAEVVAPVQLPPVVTKPASPAAPPARPVITSRTAAPAPPVETAADEIDLNSESEFGDLAEATRMLEIAPPSPFPPPTPHLAPTADDLVSDPEEIPPLESAAQPAIPMDSSATATPDVAESAILIPNVPPVDLSWARRGWRNDREADVPPAVAGSIPKTPSTEAIAPIEPLAPAETAASIEAPSSDVLPPVESVAPVEIPPMEISGDAEISEPIELAEPLEVTEPLEIVESAEAVEAAPSAQEPALTEQLIAIDLDVEPGIDVVAPKSEYALTVETTAAEPAEPVISVATDMPAAQEPPAESLQISLSPEGTTGVAGGIAGAIIGATTATASVEASAINEAIKSIGSAAASMADGSSTQEIAPPAKPRRGRPPKAKPVTPQAEVGAKLKRGKIARIPPPSPDLESTASGELPASDPPATADAPGGPIVNASLDAAILETTRADESNANVVPAPSQEIHPAELNELNLSGAADASAAGPTTDETASVATDSNSTEFPELKLNLDFDDIAPAAPAPPAIEADLKFNVEEPSTALGRPVFEGEEIEHQAIRAQETEIFEGSIAHDTPPPARAQAFSDEPKISGLQVRPEDFAAPPATVHPSEETAPAQANDQAIDLAPIDLEPVDHQAPMQIEHAATDFIEPALKLAPEQTTAQDMDIPDKDIPDKDIPGEVLESATASQSTLDLDIELPFVSDSPTGATTGVDSSGESEATADDLGDTDFGVMVEDFAGESTGPLVEPVAGTVENILAPVEATPEEAAPTNAASVEPAPMESIDAIQPAAAQEISQPVVNAAAEPDLSFWDEPGVEEPRVDPTASVEANSPSASDAFDDISFAPLEPEVPESLDLMPLATLTPPSPTAASTPTPAPIVPSAPPTPPSAGQSIKAPARGQGFDLNDGFFDTDLSSAGIVIEGAYGPNARKSATGASLQSILPNVSQVPPPAQSGATMHPDDPRRKFITQIPSIPPQGATIAPQAPPAAPTPPAAPQPQIPLDSISGVDFAAAVNFEHFLGGMPMALPNMPQPPKHFGQVAVDFGKKPLGISATAKTAAEGVPDLQNVVPPPKYETPKQPAAGKTPPFSQHPFGISSDPDSTSGISSVDKLIEGLSGDKSSGDKSAPAGITSPFDGLAMSTVRERDVFSDFDIATLSDAAFGGTPLNRSDDYVLPDSPEVAARLAEKHDGDFADDDFWNRTDDDEGSATAAGASPKGASGKGASAKGASAKGSPARRAPSRDTATTLTDPKLDAVRNQAKNISPAVESFAGLDESALDMIAGADATDDVDAAQENMDWSEAPPPTDAGGPDASIGGNDQDDFEAVAQPRTARRVGRRDPAPRAMADAVPTSTISIQSAPAPRSRRRMLIPMLMLAMLVFMGAAWAGIWYGVPPKTIATGNLTFQNFYYVSSTEEGTEFNAGQLRNLRADQPPRQRAMDLLHQQHPNVAPGFLDNPSAFEHVASSMILSPNRTGASPQTVLTLYYEGKEGEADKNRMSALVQALILENSTATDSGRRLRDAADRAVSDYQSIQQKHNQLQAQINAIQRTMGAAPGQEEFAQLELKKAQAEHAADALEDAVRRDRDTLASMQAIVANANSGGPAIEPVDPQLVSMRKEMADLTTRLAAARTAETSGANDAKKQLEAAVQQFNDQLTAAGVVLDDGSQLKKFVDSAKDAQVKSREMIMSLIVDGEDLEKQLEDTRRDMEELIQSRQREKFAADDQLRRLQDNLDSAQHRYNAAVGQGFNDPVILKNLKSEIDTDTIAIKARQAQLGVESGEIKIQDDMNRVIESLRNKLTREKKQIDLVLDPLEKQFSDLGPAVSSLPSNQQDLAKQLHDRLATLNEARQKYAVAVGDSAIAPSANVTDLQKQLDDLKARFDRRQADLTAQLKNTTADSAGLASAQQKLEDDKKALDEATKAYNAVRVQYRDAEGKREDAQAGQAQLASLSNDLKQSADDLEKAGHDRDQKQLLAGSSYTIKPFEETTDVGLQIFDHRKDYWSYSLAGIALLFALLVFAVHSAPEPVIIPARQEPPHGAGFMRPADALSIPSPTSNGNGHSEDDQALTI
jgi:pSer/pThr/pTyr-binding forkhead associated (FHA) protein